ncbi:MAG: MMPL family transporter [Planctomycetota bacterium]|jgi:hopanoid biosynthesis associated RND transporter like protein HpnN
MHERIRDNILAWWGRFVASHPIATLIVCVPLAVGCVVLTATGLEFRSDRSQLIDPGKSWNQEYAEYQNNFPRFNDIFVVLDGDPENGTVDQLAKLIARRLGEDPRVMHADAGFDVATASPRFFTFAQREQFDQTLKELAKGRRITAAENANAALAVMLAELTEGQGDRSDLDRLDQLLVPFLAAARDQSADFAFLRPGQSRWQSLSAPDSAGRLRFVQVHLGQAGSGVNQIGPTLSWLRGFVRDIVGESDSAGVQWGVTGIPAIESDETTQAVRDSTLASILAITLITLVMFAAFRGFTVPLLAAGALLVGMAWSFGWLMISVGHLQLLSVVFSVILLGLGIDFALLFVSRLELVQDEHRDLASATSRVYRRMGPGMVTGAVTTAAAFAAIAFTDFKGMAEMGIIAAGGILLCLIAVLSAFPALLALTRRWKRIIRHRPGGETAHFARGRLDVVDTHPIPTLIVAGLVVAVLAWLALSVEYDPNVLNLQSAGVESVQWERRVVDEDARSVWSGVVLARPEEAAHVVDRLRKATGVADVGGMGLLVPHDRIQRERLITELRETEVEPLGAEPGLDGLLTQLAAVRTGIRLRARTVPPDVRGRLEATIDRIDESTTAARRLTPARGDQAWAGLNAAFIDARNALAKWLDAALAARPPSAEDLPEVLRDLWVGVDGSWLLLVYPEADPQQRSILAPERLGPFVDSVRGVLAGTGKTMIGPPVQIFESSKLLKTEYIKAACYAVAAILVLLFLDFRRLADALCAMAPVTVGFVGAFGLMGLIGVPLNFANIIILPIIFGIGVNAGVHVVHRWRAEPYGRPRGLSGATGRGITLTMLTTMIGFGCLLIAEHRGIRSLGFVMVMGLGVTLLACYTVLPATLRLRTPALSHATGEARGRMLRPARVARKRLWSAGRAGWRRSA